MSRATPVLARYAVQLFAPSDLADALLGDLEEELSLLPSGLGRIAGSLWYWRQIGKSVGPLMKIRIARGELIASVALSQLVFVLPLLAVESLRSFLLSNVPLKIDSAFSAASTVLLVSLAGICAAVGSFLLCSLRSGMDRLALLLFAMICVVYGVLGLVPFASWKLAGTTFVAMALGLMVGPWLWRQLDAGKNPSGEIQL